MTHLASFPFVTIIFHNHFTDVGRCRDESGTPPLTDNMVIDDERYVGGEDCISDYACTNVNTETASIL